MWQLAWKVYGSLIIWDSSLPKLPCIMEIINKNFNHSTVQIVGRHQDMDILIRFIMYQYMAVYIPGRYKATVLQAADVFLGPHGSLEWPYYVPKSWPVATDTIYLPPASLTLEDIYAGPHSANGKSLIILNNNADPYHLKLLTFRVKLLHVAVIVNDTIFTWYMNDPNDCNSYIKTLHVVGTCNNTNSVYVPKSVNKFNNCPIFLKQYKEKEGDKWCSPFGGGPILTGFPYDKVQHAEGITLSAIAEILKINLVYYRSWQWKTDVWSKMYNEKRTELYYYMMTNFEYKKAVKEKFHANGKMDLHKWFITYIPDELPFWDQYVDMMFFCVSRNSEVAYGDYDRGIEGTLSYVTDLHRWIVPAPYEAPQYTGLVAGLNYALWICIFLSLVAFIFVDLYLIKNSTLLGVIFRCTASMSQQGISNPSNWELLFIYYALHITTIYQASLLDSLFHAPMRDDYNSVDDAIADGGDMHLTLNAYLYFRRSGKNEILDKYMRKKTDIPKDAKLTNEYFSENVTQSMRLRCFISYFCSMIENWDCQIRAKKEFSKKVLPEVVYSENYQFLMPVGHPLLPRINEVISWVFESGLVEAVKHRHTHIVYSILEKQAKEQIDGPRQLSNAQLRTAYFVMFLMLLTSIFIFICERMKRTERPTNRAKVENTSAIIEEITDK